MLILHERSGPRSVKKTHKNTPPPSPSTNKKTTHTQTHTHTHTHKTNNKQKQTNPEVNNRPTHRDRAVRYRPGCWSRNRNRSSRHRQVAGSCTSAVAAGYLRCKTGSTVAMGTKVPSCHPLKDTYSVQPVRSEVG